MFLTLTHSRDAAQQRAERRIAAGGPAHAREAAVGLAVEAAWPGQEHLDPAHRDAAAIAIPVGAVLRMLWLSLRTRHRADAGEARVVSPPGDLP